MAIIRVVNAEGEIVSGCVTPLESEEAVQYSEDR